MLKAVQENTVPHAVFHNYRKAPAVGLAKQMIESGELGTIYHWRATYLQDWIADPNFPLVWRLQKEVAGSGAHGDINAHIIDMARHLLGARLLHRLRSIACTTDNRRDGDHQEHRDASHSSTTPRCHSNRHGFLHNREGPPPDDLRQKRFPGHPPHYAERGSRSQLRLEFPRNRPLMRRLIRQAARVD